MADLMDETDDGVGTSRADAAGAGGTATAAALGAAAPAAANSASASGAAGLFRSHSAGALETFTALLNDDDGDDDDDKPKTAASASENAGANAGAGGNATVPPRIAVVQARAQARVEILEKQLELVRQQQKTTGVKAIGAGSPIRAGAGPGSPSAATSTASTDSPVAPHIAAAQARADALEKLLQMRDAEAPDARIVAAQARAAALEKQLLDEAAAKAEGAKAAPAQTVPAAAFEALPFQRLDSNPRRPARNSGFPLPLLSTKDDKYIPPKIKSLDGFRAAFDLMRANMKSKNNKRKASEMSDARNADCEAENDNSTAADDKIPLPEATFNGDIFSNMIYRGKIDLTEQDWTVTGMYSINERSKAAAKIRQRQTEHILIQKVEVAKAEAAAAMAAPAPGPAAPATQTTKRKKTWTAEQEQTIAELKRQKAELDEKLARHQAAKSKEKATASPAPNPTLGGSSLLPPILPNAAIDPRTGTPKAPPGPSAEDVPVQDAEQAAERLIHPASVKPDEIRPLVSNEAMGAASSLLDLIPQVARKAPLGGAEKGQVEMDPSDDSQKGPENGTKRSADELTAENTTDQGPLSPNSEDKMIIDLETLGKRKKARRLTPSGSGTSAENGTVGVGGKPEEDMKAANTPNTGCVVARKDVVATEGAEGVEK